MMSTCGGSGDELSAELITPELLKMVKHNAWKMARRTGGHVDQDDLFSAAQYEIVRALQRYTPERGEFKWFALNRARGAMLDEMRRLDPTPRRYRGMIREASRKHESELTDEDRKALSQRKVIVHTDAELANFLDYAQQSEHTGLSDVRQLDSSLLVPLVRRLDPREQFVVWQHVVFEVPLAPLGAFLGCTESRACQLLKRGLMRLRFLYTTIGRKAV
jgi:RNA polymerase sigma factor for flagellar operon FliA